jgi:hypothetical protein
MAAAYIFRMFRCPERRSAQRLPVVAMRASISLQNRFGAHHGEVVDFNRHGITVALQRPIATNRPLIVELTYQTLRLGGIVGAAHHCRYTREGSFRCGIRFRTNSPAQLDRDEIDQRLIDIERALGAALTAATT